MWWLYLLAFIGGSMIGVVVMGLCAASREADPHEVHVYCDEDGNLEVMSFPPGDKIIWHTKPEDMGG